MINSSLTLPAPVQAYFDQVLLSVPTPSLIMTLGAMRKSLPAKSGTTLRMRRYDRLPTSMIPLSPNGDSVPPTELSVVDIDATVSLYGQYVAINQAVTLHNQDPVLNETSELLGLSLRETEDALTRDCLASSASVVNCTGGTNGDLPSNLSPSDLQDVVSILINNNAWTILDRQIGEDRFGTSPTRDSYIALSHAKLTSEWNNLNGFVSKWNYANPDATLRSEWGAFENLRVFVSSVGSVQPNASALGQDVYQTFVTGLEAYAVVEQDNFSANFIYRPAIFSDPLAQNVTLGYTFGQVPKILNELWICRVRSTLR